MLMLDANSPRRAFLLCHSWVDTFLHVTYYGFIYMAKQDKKQHPLFH